MADRPTLDEMKIKRDGWLAAGKPRPLRPGELDEIVVRAWLYALRVERHGE